MYDYLFLTHLPVFYKVNLYNEIAREKNIHVVFVGCDTDEKRSVDFSSLSNAHFTYTVLSKNSFQSRNKLLTCIRLLFLLRKVRFRKIVVGGWDLPEFWVSLFISPKKKNCLALESTVHESGSLGIRAFIKKLFLSRVKTVFASGELHVELLSALSFTGSIIKTLGVGIINYSTSEEELINKDKVYSGKYLFIGRLSEEKNLASVIESFQNMPDLELNIIGDGPQAGLLKKYKAPNVRFHGSVSNSALPKYLGKNDFLLLPSLRETWGLVVEEALSCNVPVIVSDRCGSIELVQHGFNGLIYPVLEENSLEDLLSSISQELFVQLKQGASIYSVKKKDTEQVLKYTGHLS